MATPVQVGPWSVSSSAAPDVVVDGMGFMLPAGGVMTNTSQQPQEVFAQVQPDTAPAVGQPPATGLPAIPAPVQGLVQPRGSVSLTPPPVGYSWMVGWVSRRTVREWLLWGLGGILLVGSLSGLGIADVVRMVRDKKKRARR